MSIKIEAFKDVSPEKLRELSNRLQKSFTDEQTRNELPPFLVEYINADNNALLGHHRRIQRCLNLINQEVLNRFYSEKIN